MLFYQICSVKMLTLQLVIRLAFLARSYTPESISKKNHVTTLTTLSIGAIYLELPQRKSPTHCLKVVEKLLKKLKNAYEK